MSTNLSGKPDRLPMYSGSVGLDSCDKGVVVIEGLWEYETPEGSVGKMLVSSIFPEIHRCIRVMYSWAGSSTGSLFRLSQVKEWLLPRVSIWVIHKETQLLTLRLTCVGS